MDNWGVCHTCYIATAAQKLNKRPQYYSSLWICSHLKTVLKNQNKKNSFFYDKLLSWLTGNTVHLD